VPMGHISHNPCICSSCNQFSSHPCIYQVGAAWNTECTTITV
ncbi:hypothetical protein AVDCRST_MAG94-5080, partial [uncultured Leptolyngbya sp.]